MRYLQTVFCSIFLTSQTIEIVASKAREMKVAFLPPLGIQDNAKFSISLVLKMSAVSFFTRRYLCFLHSTNI